MKFVLAPDSFKESMSAAEAAAAMAAGVRAVHPEAECIEVPMSDGGEGFAEAVTAAWGAEWISVETVDALGRPITAGYGLTGSRAVVAMASCAGLELIAPEDRDVTVSTTRGLGVMIRHALGRGAEELLIGIGGSATNDAGTGMLIELGVRLLDADGAECGATLAELSRVVRVDTSGTVDGLADLRIQVACDVDNPLNGPSGATAIFGPQKGVQAADIERIDGILRSFARVSGFDDVAHAAGAGAAGGLGFALMAFLGGELRPGVELVSDAVGLAEAVSGASLVLTGEGAVDEQTLHGKTPAGVAAVARRAGVPVILFAGRVSDGAENLRELDVVDLIQIVGDDVPLERALREGAANLSAAVERTLRASTEGSRHEDSGGLPPEHGR